MANDPHDVLIKNYETAFKALRGSDVDKAEWHRRKAVWYEAREALRQFNEKLPRYRLVKSIGNLWG